MMVHNERPFFKITRCSRSNELNNRDWSSLPADILRDISSRLMFIDYFSFANVCTSWRRSAKRLCPQILFVLLHQYCFLAEFKPKPFCKLLNLTDNMSDNVRLPLLGGKVCIGSQHGWLVVVDKTVSVISLYNPYSQEVIKMPSHAPLVYYPNLVVNVRKVVLSGAPISSTAPLPAAAVVFYRCSNILYRRDGQSSWKYMVQHYFFLDVTWWRGKFVGVTELGNVLEADLDAPELKFEHITSQVHDTALYNKHLVNLDDVLFQVWWSIDSQFVQTRSSVSSTDIVKVMRLDPQLLTWMPVDDLCGHSLFVGSSHSLALSSQHIPGLKDNLIYFIQDLWGFHWDPSFKRTDWKRDIRVFNMRTGSCEICVLTNIPLVPSMFDDLCGHSTTSAFWYTPPLSVLQNGSL